jgi:serine/threonine-protein kinase
MDNIGRYQLVEKLGQGGMGIVYRAFDTLLQRVVALKVISGNLETGPEQRERFFREARAAGQLSHRNIITIHDLGEVDGQPYLAMEYLQGEDLQRRLAGPDRMSVARKVDLVIQACEGLEYAHSHGVVHRDVKPANIFLTDNGTVKILDFGLARLVTSERTVGPTSFRLASCCTNCWAGARHSTPTRSRRRCSRFFRKTPSRSPRWIHDFRAS